MTQRQRRQRNEITRIALEQQQQQNTKSSTTTTKLVQNSTRKASLNALKSLLPVIQENYQSRTSSSLLETPITNKTRHVSVECKIENENDDDWMIPLELAVWLELPQNARFTEFQTHRLIEPRTTSSSSDEKIRIGGSLLRSSSSSYERNAPLNRLSRRSAVVYLQEIALQTCELPNSEIERNRLVVKLANVFVASVNTCLEPKQLAHLIGHLSIRSLSCLVKYLCATSSSTQLNEICQRLSKLRCA